MLHNISIRLIGVQLSLVVAGMYTPVFSQAKSKDSSKVLTMMSESRGPVIGARHPDVVASANRSGFQTGQVVKVNKTYHMFVNEMFDRPHRDLRISYWTSDDAVNRAEPGDHYTRTPICAIEEEDGTYTVVYTAMMRVEGKNFYAIGKCPRCGSKRVLTISVTL
jgi:hypothetical protein